MVWWIQDFQTILNIAISPNCFSEVKSKSLLLKTDIFLLKTLESQIETDKNSPSSYLDFIVHFNYYEIWKVEKAIKTPFQQHNYGPSQWTSLKNTHKCNTSGIFFMAVISSGLIGLRNNTLGGKSYLVKYTQTTTYNYWS